MNKAAFSDVTILGAGLVGSMLATYLRQQGIDVTVYEKRDDIRTHQESQGRSINLALSHRGWLSLKEIGLADEVSEITIPMRGRMMHAADGKLTFQPYGKEGEAIYSVSRGLLNEILTTKAESLGAVFKFRHQCEGIDLDNNTLHLKHLLTDKVLEHKAELLIGSDGAFSKLRQAFAHKDRFNYEQYYIPHGYKELNIPADENGKHKMDPEALHIWPRGQFMLIALPNLDGSFTCTLFLPFEGKTSFESLNTEEKVLSFFADTFSDIVPLMPALAHDFFDNPTASLVTIKCFPWQYGEKALLIGDAAHAIVPFYGQGMNAGFEDCRILNSLLSDKSLSQKEILNTFQNNRKENADAIADLALDNFVEMRDKVADPKFLVRKKIESKLHALYPHQWVPLYSQVTFSATPYATAFKNGRLQNKIMDEVMMNDSLIENWEQMDFHAIIQKMDTMK